METPEMFKTKIKKSCSEIKIKCKMMLLQQNLKEKQCQTAKKTYCTVCVWVT